MSTHAPSHPKHLVRFGGVGRNFGNRAAVGLLTIATAAACNRPPELASCAESISGVWRDPAGHRWTILDRGARLEVFPDFADTQLPLGTDPTLATGLVVAPRALDLVREGTGLTGVVHRRYQRGGAECDPAPPVRITACRGATLSLELPEPPAPIALEPCSFPPAAAPAPPTTWTWAARLD